MNKIYRTEYNRRIKSDCVNDNASSFTKELISESIDKDISREIYYNAYHDGYGDANIEWIKRIVKCSGIAFLTAVLIKKIRA